jgi:hypothetical protein
MICSNCEKETEGVCEDNVIWCDCCGNAMKSSQVFVHSYCQSYGCRTAIYNRRKRFEKYARSFWKTDIVTSFHKILDLYSSLEFVWTSSKCKSGRTYFFARSVMLGFCCDLLKLNVNNLPRLKDKQREKLQYSLLNKIIDSDIWKTVYGAWDIKN